MNILFFSCYGHDYISSVLWDGLSEIVGGRTNIVSAHPSPYLHHMRNQCPPWPSVNEPVVENIDQQFDLMVINDSFLRDNNWEWLETHRHRMKSDAKLVYVHGDDGYNTGCTPPFPVHAYFRREIHPDYSYPYKPIPMLMASPLRWFLSMFDYPVRDIDVIYAGNPSSDARWQMAAKVFQTTTRHRSLVATAGLLPHDTYFSLLRRSKLAICPPGAGSDCMRQWEVIACGAIPVFVGHPPRIREPWFANDEIYTCDNCEDLPKVLDEALASDLESRRKRLKERALQYHTTRYRAETLLKAVGLL